MSLEEEPTEEDRSRILRDRTEEDAKLPACHLSLTPRPLPPGTALASDPGSSLQPHFSSALPEARTLGRANIPLKGALVNLVRKGLHQGLCERMSMYWRI